MNDKGLIMQNEFTGRIAVVSGGSRGIGRGIAEALAREGAEVALVSSSETNLAARSLRTGRRRPPSYPRTFAHRL